MVVAIFKDLYGEGICRCLYPLLHIQCTFQPPADDEQAKIQDGQYGFLCNFLIVRFVSCCISDIRCRLGVFFMKKEDRT